MARDASATWPDDALEVGRIGEAWGLKGGFRVLAYADPPDALLAASRWHLRAGEDARRPAAAAALPATLEIASVRASGEGLVASSPAVPDRTAAEALRGARIFIARSQFPATTADEFYWADLIGLGVVNRDGLALGAVVGLIDTGPQSVLRIQPAADGADEVLIPFVSAYVDSVDLAARRIVVDWGLDY
ncbi:MAG TPA: ribosome maturation factor RimM [Caldimonas sp.]|nr:ribosome maturation factor RimM [Caldimonas sp.]HEV7574659.1 ribosome maturation factor RimM [Caldimonas sp.]